jgi:hypothetical protein
MKECSFAFGIKNSAASAPVPKIKVSNVKEVPLSSKIIPFALWPTGVKYSSFGGQSLKIQMTK